MTQRTSSHPLVFDPHTNEPYIRVRGPHSNIIITPPRQTPEEVTALVSALNDRRILSWIEIPFYPYEQTHAEEWLASSCGESSQLLNEIQKNPEAAAKGCPVFHIREVKASGGDIFIGAVRISLWKYDDIQDPTLRKRLIEENEQREYGDPQKEWTFGDYLVPSHHGRGIMTSVIDTLIGDWMIPRMGVRKINVGPHKGNIGSVRVFEKNGFILKKTLTDWKNVARLGAEERVGIHILGWVDSDSRFTD